MSTLLKEINLNKNPQEFWSKYFSSIFAPHISVVLIKLQVNPNIITLSMIPFSILCLYFSIFIFDKNLNLFLISLVGVCINIIDFVDGIVARHSNKVSTYGKYLDRICHYAANPTIFLAYGIYAIQVEKNITGFLFLIITILDLFDVASKDFLYMININKEEFRYSKLKKFKLSIKDIRDNIIRIFFLPLTCIPHTVLILFPLFIYYDNLILFYALLFLIQLFFKIIKRSKNIRKKYEQKY